MNEEKITTVKLKKMKESNEKIVMITAYDYAAAQLVDDSGIEVILVGDSLGNVVLGYETTLPVTVNDMIHHGKAVVRGSNRSLIVIDMPFLSYQVSKEDAIRNAGRIIQETGATAVKMEGGIEIIPAVKGIINAGIPVMGHLGLTPQSVAQLGGFKVQGKDTKVARKIIDDSLALEDAGAFSIVLECVPWQLAKIITERLAIPIIGIGAGIHCDGQVLVFHDVMGLYDGKRPKFVKQYVDAGNEMKRGVKEYVKEVKESIFPGSEHGFNLPESVLKDLNLNQ